MASWSYATHREEAMAAARAERTELDPPPAAALDKPQPAARWVINAHCARCGGPLEHQAQSVTNGVTAQATGRCVPCRRTYSVVVRLHDVTKDINHRPAKVAGSTHGTYSCYAAGCRRPECRAAAAAYQRDRRASQRAQVPA
jgi:hypothetical protein